MAELDTSAAITSLLVQMLPTRFSDPQPLSERGMPAAECVTVPAAPPTASNATVSVSTREATAAAHPQKPQTLEPLFAPRRRQLTRSIDADCIAPSSTEASVVEDVPLHELQYASGHGLTPHTHSTMNLVFGLVKLLAPRVCVIIGSGSGLVPRVVREAQTHALNAGSCDTRTYLIDMGEGYGAMPGHIHASASKFRQLYPEIVVLKNRSVPDGLAALRALGVSSIDVLWIDGDHSHKGSSDDFCAFSPLVPVEGIVFMHDTAPNGAGRKVPGWCGVPHTLADIRAGGGWDMLNFMSSKDQAFGCGLAVLQRKRVPSVPPAVPSVTSVPTAVTSVPTTVPPAVSSSAQRAEVTTAAHSVRAKPSTPSPWPYLSSPAFSVRQQSIAHFLDAYPTIVEIGGGVNPVARFVRGKRCIIIDPTCAVEAAPPGTDNNVEYIPKGIADVDVESLGIVGPFALVVFGLDWVAMSAAESTLRSKAACAVYETTTDLPTHVRYMDVVKSSYSCPPAVEFDLKIAYRQSPEELALKAYPPRCNRRICVFFSA
jgi:hypothetical protein